MWSIRYIESDKKPQRRAKNWFSAIDNQTCHNTFADKIQYAIQCFINAFNKQRFLFVHEVLFLKIEQKTQIQHEFRPKRS